MAPSETYQDFLSRVDVLAGDFAQAVKSGRRGSIVDRMHRSRAVYDLMTDYSAKAQRDSFRGKECPFDVADMLYKRFLMAMESHCIELAKCKKNVFSIPGEVTKLSQELQRIAAEGLTFLQFGELHRAESDVNPMNIKEDVFMVFSKAFEKAFPGQNTTVFLCTTLGELMDVHRKTDDESVLEHCRNCISLTLAMVPLKNREQQYDTIEKHYLAKLGQTLQAKKMDPNLKVYLKWVSSTIEQEMERCRLVFKRDTTVVKSKRAVQVALVKERTKKILDDPNEGVHSTLQFPNVKPTEFRQLFNVLEFDAQCLKQMRQFLSTAVSQALKTGTSKGARDILHLVRVKNAYAQLVKGGVHKEHQLDFHLAVQEGCAAAVPTDGSFEEAVVLRIDAIIRGKDVSGEVTDPPAATSSTSPSPPADSAAVTKGRAGKKELLATFEVFSLITLPSLFTDHYKHTFSNRILLKPRPNIALEQYAVNEVIKRMPNAALKAHLSTMLEETVNSNGALRHAAVWPGGWAARPANPRTEKYGNYAPEIASAFNEFVGKERKRHPSSDVWVTPEFSVVQLSATFPPSPHSCHILATAPQAQTLLTLFKPECATGKTEADLRTITQLPAAALSVALLTLKSTGLILFNASAKTYGVNMEYMLGETGPKKIALPTTGTAKR